MSAKQDWREFRAAREAELGAPYGWLTLTGFHWLPTEPGELPGLPGRWWSDGTDAHCAAEAADGLTLDGTPVDGPVAASVAETSRTGWLRHGGVDIELLRRGGRLAVRTRTETSAARQSFAGVPSFDYDPTFEVSARFVPYPAGTTVDVATHRPDLRQVLPAIGEVTFTLGGRPQRLVATNIKTGPSVEFHDPTNGVETPAWRQLKFDQPDADGRVTLDFNRTLDMWFAFTEHATCPAPVDGNTISVPVRAGERSPA